MNRSLKKAIIILLVIGGSIFVLLFDLKLALDWIDHELEPKYDENGKMIYQDDRHTIVSFGNNRFSIEKGVWNGETIKCLIDRKKSGPEATIDYIERYKEVLSCVYTIGEKGYTKLNSETAEIIQNKDINLFSEEDIKIFKELEAGEGGIKH